MPTWPHYKLFALLLHVLSHYCWIQYTVQLQYWPKDTIIISDYIGPLQAYTNILVLIHGSITLYLQVLIIVHYLYILITMYNFVFGCIGGGLFHKYLPSRKSTILLLNYLICSDRCMYHFPSRSIFLYPHLLRCQTWKSGHQGLGMGTWYTHTDNL